MYDNGSMVRMEKRAVNKIGLALIILIAVAALGGGIFFLVKNHNNLDFSFPWSKSKKEQQAEKTKKEKEKIALERQKIDITQNKATRISGATIYPNVLTYDKDVGYKISLNMINSRNNPVEIKMFNITIDGFQIDYQNEVTLSAHDSQVVLITIPNEYLDLYNIETFKKIYVYADGKEIKPTTISTSTTTDDNSNDSSEKEQFSKIVIKNSELGENTQTPSKVSNVGNIKDVKIDFYKKEETGDSTDLYFLVTNKNSKDNNYYTIELNAYKVNNDILTNNDFKEKVYDKCTKIVKISIPKSRYKNVDNVTLSFFVMRDDDIYTTKITTLEFNNK